MESEILGWVGNHLVATEHSPDKGAREGSSKAKLRGPRQSRPVFRFFLVWFEPELRAAMIIT
jgi:hypothetical protein